MGVMALALLLGQVAERGVMALVLMMLLEKVAGTGAMALVMQGQVKEIGVMALRGRVALLRRPVRHCLAPRLASRPAAAARRQARRKGMVRSASWVAARRSRSGRGTASSGSADPP